MYKNNITAQRIAVLISLFISHFLLFFTPSCSYEERKKEGEFVVEPETAMTEKQTVKATRGPVEEVVTLVSESSSGEEAETANELCIACHFDFAVEQLALDHEALGVGCQRCHGESHRHMADENHQTPPDIMYPKSRIVPTCMVCHSRLTIEHVGHHKPILTELKTVSGWDKAEADKRHYCTDCHAKQHRINNRNFRWDKCTGELIKE